MENFTQKLILIYTKMFREDIDKFTEAFIDYNKFDRNKFNFESEEESHKQFFSNRKTVLRRWLLNGNKCTPDFQKSFYNYKISTYRFQGETLFTLDDFREEHNLTDFEKKIDAYLLYQQRAYINTDYRYIYAFDEEQEALQSYTITKWIKGDRDRVTIHLEYEGKTYSGTFSLQEDSNIFMTIKIEQITLYLLFHDTNDSSCNYIVGTSMGYLTKDNIVPRATKVILAKQKLNSSDIDLQFILNETEVISAIENRLNLNNHDLKVNPLVRYSRTFKKYHTLFSRFVEHKFQQNFYYRLAFREFYAIYKLFERVSKKESYFIFNQQRAFFELIKTLEAIKDIPFYMVMEFTSKNIFLQSTQKDIEIKKRFLNLQNYGIESHLIFIVENTKTISHELEMLLKEMHEHQITVRVVCKEKIIHEINSIDFFFIHLKDSRDFVLADPLRDNKDVYKLFTNRLTMEEYRIDYQTILNKSIDYLNISSTVATTFQPKS
ncbi:hypothetical protein KKC13_06715 [bacterium]|nr:hypothetical protein [bacterium]MBU1958601.1 hypothetical protein [bacterium]